MNALLKPFYSFQTRSNHMSSAHFILLGLIGLCPDRSVNEPLLPYLVPFLLAAGLLSFSVKLPAREAQHMANKVVSRPYVLGAGYSAVLMIFKYCLCHFGKIRSGRA